jgi:hypothetical protein
MKQGIFFVEQRNLRSEQGSWFGSSAIDDPTVGARRSICPTTDPTGAGRRCDDNGFAGLG